MRTTTWVGGGLALAVVASSPLIRHWYLTWGATAEEVERVMPGDDLLPGADMQSTRAITIDAPPAHVWPWLVQIGNGGPSMRVEICDRAKTLALRSEDGRWVWIFGLYPLWGGTRLVSRNRITEDGASFGRRLADRLIMEPGSLVMERKMLIGIRDRAESAIPEPALRAAVIPA